VSIVEAVVNQDCVLSVLVLGAEEPVGLVGLQVVEEKEHAKLIVWQSVEEKDIGLVA